MTVRSNFIQESHWRGCEAWPEFDLAASRFEAHVHRLALSEASLEHHSEDLFLVFAVLEGDPRALAVFDNGYLRHACQVTLSILLTSERPDRNGASPP